MTNKGKKLEPPLRLDMDDGEALERFLATSPVEVDESVNRAKQQKPPEDDSGGLEVTRKGNPADGRRRKPPVGG